jgi:alkylation response protein AidB-like acyl-CoA dehydrogenase
MDFAIGDQQRRILDTVDRFLARRLPAEEVRRRDREHIPPYDLLPEMGELGLFALGFPTAQGGLGEAWTTVALVQERLAYHAYFAGSIYNRMVGFGATSILAYGTDAQRREILPRIFAGQCLCALALSEPEAGSDAAAVRARARRGPGGWVLSGRKTWISDADRADYLVTIARTGPGDGARGLSVFLVPRRSPGIAMTELAKIGNNCMPSFDVGFDDVLAPDEALMGAEGQGFQQIMATLHVSRASLAATTVGAAQRAVDIALAHAKERRQFGRPIGKFQAIAHRLAEMQTRVDQARLMVWQLAWLIACGLECRRQAAQAKIMASETLQFVADSGMQILASAGYSADSDMQRIWRDARLYSFGEGTNEIQRDIVARELGL